MLWLSFSLLTAGLGAGLVLNGGALPQQWNWSILAIAIAGLFSGRAHVRREYTDRPSFWSADRWITAILFALPLWAAFQMVPLPQRLVAFLSPMRAEISRVAGATSWIPLSIAPARTFQSLLDVVASAVTFLVIRDLADAWRRKIWLVTLPIISFGCMEGLLGLYQFYAARQSRDVQPSSGTWINPDHFSGFLEMALPLAVTGAFAAWRSGVLRRETSGGKALRVAASLGVAAICLAAIVVSLSRAGFFAAICSLAVMPLIVLFGAGQRFTAVPRIPRARRIAAVLAVVAIASGAFLLLPTDELIARFGLAVGSTESVSGETRLELWRDTRKLIAAYPVTGSGLGTYESALMRFKTAAPMRTADYAHNDYLQVAAELGIAGAAIALIWITLVFIRSVRAAISNDASPNRCLALGTAGSMVAILLHSLVDFNLYIPANAMVFAWICGIAASAPLRARPPVAAAPGVRVIQAAGWR